MKVRKMKREASLDNQIKQLEEHFTKQYDREYCIFTDRGTTLTYAFLMAVKDEVFNEKNDSPGKVVLPDILCPSMANAVIYAGFEPLFCDVNLKNFTMDIQSLENLLASNSDIQVVIPVHLYGFLADMNPIESLTKDYNIKVLEDAAQALGATYNEKKCGCFGNASFFSFGRAKILDCNGGAVLLTNEETIALKIRKCLATLPSKPGNFRERSERYRRTYYSIDELALKDISNNRLFLEMPYDFKDIYIYHSEDPVVAGNIIEGLENLDDNISQRREKGRMYQRLLIHPSIKKPDFDENGAYWRYSFLLDDDIRNISNQLRDEQIDVSNWYPPLHSRYHASLNQDETKLKNSIYVGEHIMNLWTDYSVSVEKVKWICERLLEIIEKSNITD
jgi:dTDP-4-amino-4,6-dideoxygalactose transaminase